MDKYVQKTPTETIRTGLNETLNKSLWLYGADYETLSIEQKQLLGALVSSTKALSAMLGKTASEA